MNVGLRLIMRMARRECAAHPQHVRDVADAAHDELREAAHGNAAVAGLVHLQGPRTLRQKVAHLAQGPVHILRGIGCKTLLTAASAVSSKT